MPCPDCMEAVWQTENVWCYLPVQKLGYFPDLTVAETLWEVSSLPGVGCQTISFSQTKFARASRSSPVIRKQCFLRRRDASHVAELQMERESREQLGKLCPAPSPFWLPPVPGAITPKCHLKPTVTAGRRHRETRVHSTAGVKHR